MTDERYNENLGFYTPSFLGIYTDIEIDFSNIAKLDDYSCAIFLHEYIHFIQDISTTAGLGNAITVVGYMQSINKKIIGSNNKNFFVPIDESEYLNSTSKWNYILRKLYLGSGKNNANSISNIFVRNEKLNFFLPNGKSEIEKIVIETENKNEIFLGEYYISESMAYEIETYLYPNVLPKPSVYPYQSVRLIVDALYPKLTENALNLIAICDISLLFPNSGFALYQMLIEMRNKDFTPSEPEQIYEFVFKNINIYGYPNINEVLSDYGSNAIFQLCGYFTNNIFADNKEYIRYIISKAIEFRINNISFIIDILKCGKLQENELFVFFLKIFGSPTITMPKETMFFEPNLDIHIKPEYFFAIKQIYNIYRDGLCQKKPTICQLTNFCRNSAINEGRDDYVDYRCRTEPWTRTNDENLCIFAQVWRTWGLEGHNPITKESEEKNI